MTGIVAVALTSVFLAERALSQPPPRHRGMAVAPFVTGAAAEALGADGRFALADSIVNPSGQISESQAREIAESILLRFNAQAKMLSRNSGAPVRPRVLHACDRAIYASSPVTDIKGTPSERLRRYFGPHWVVPLCGEGTVAESMMSFSALATELITSLDNPVPPLSDADLMTFPISSVDAQQGVFAPEAAARRAFQLTGKRVATVPYVVMAGNPTTPVIVRWRLTLESPVAVKGVTSGTIHQTATLFVGFGRTFHVVGLLDRLPTDSVRPFHDYDKHLVQLVYSSDAPVNVELVRPTTP